MTTRVCTVDGCNEVVRARGWCNTHYKQRYTAGDFEPYRRQRQKCIIEDCPNHDRGPHGLCSKHLSRLKRNGDPRRLTGPYRPEGHESPHWQGDDISNAAMHRRIERQCGKAKNHACVDCGGQAKHWSYNHTDDSERTDPRDGPYGLGVEHYSPRCVSCHKKFDLNRSKV